MEFRKVCSGQGTVMEFYIIDHVVVDKLGNL